MSFATQIPAVTFQVSDYNADTKEIFINLNNNLELNSMFDSYKKSHRRIFPEINVVSPTGKMQSFNFPQMDKWEIVFQGAKGLKVRLGFN
jgi:hypothetical protein